MESNIVWLGELCPTFPQANDQSDLSYEQSSQCLSVLLTWSLFARFHRHHTDDLHNVQPVDRNLNGSLEDPKLGEVGES